jgi:hypothetical protein
MPQLDIFSFFPQIFWGFLFFFLYFFFVSFYILPSFALSFKEMEKLIVSCSNYFESWNKKVQLQILETPFLTVNREYLVNSFPFYNSRVLKFETFLARKLFPKLIVKKRK